MYICIYVYIYIYIYIHIKYYFAEIFKESVIESNRALRVTHVIMNKEKKKEV